MRGAGIIARVLAAAFVVLGWVGFSGDNKAAAADVHAWATIRSTRPGVGCTVNVSVEVRAGGEPAAGVPVAVAFFDGASDLLASDEGATGDDGIAWLAFDTGGASAGTDGWLDVDVGDSYLGGTSILPQADGGCDGEVGTIDGGAAAAIPDTAATNGGDDSGGFPTHYQEHTLSCEYAAIYIATASFGNPVYEDQSIADVPPADDPHFGFRGDIDGPFGSSDDYGVYAEALVPVLEAYGFVGEVWYDPGADALMAQLDAGHPTLIWIATRGDTSYYDEDANGNVFKLVPWEHVLVAYAYDDGGVYVSDPGTGGLDHLSWGWTIDARSVLDGMALSVYPA
jgi:Peptidase_C39 like family